MSNPVSERETAASLVKKIFQFFLWLKPLTTPYQARKIPFFKVTHPYHPLFGREFELVSYSHCWTEKRAFYLDDAGKLTSIPALWTDIGPPDPFIELSNGRSVFRVTDLLELSNFLAILKDKRVK